MKENNKAKEADIESKLGWSISGDGLHLLYTQMVGKHLVTVTASDFLQVVAIEKNLDTQGVKLTILHRSATSNHKIYGSLTKLSKTKIFKFLTSRGVVIYEGCSSVLGDYLMSQVDGLIQNRQISYIHERVGWGAPTDYSKGYFAHKSIKSSYPSVMRDNQANLMGPNGDKAIYDKMVQNEVIPNKSLHLPFVLAFTAPIVPLMFKDSACPVLLTNFAGKTSMGKSTSISLMASVWGSGQITNQRLSIAKTFASTQVGFEANVNANNGFPVLFDDYESAGDDISFGQLIYTLAAGESKNRCKGSGKLRQTFQWRTHIGLTGESSIFERAAKKFGLGPRIVEFKNVKWTVSKMNSIAITGTTMEHYGFYGELFVTELMKRKTAIDLHNLYKACEKEINDAIPPRTDNVAERIQTRLAIILMTANLVKELLNLNVDIDYIKKLLIDNEMKRQENLDVYTLAKEKAIGYINKNLTAFVRYNNRDDVDVIPNRAICGRIYRGKQGNCVAILAELFRENVLDEFNDKEAILEKWRDEKFLITDKDGRFTKKTYISDLAASPRCYVLVFEDLNNIVNYGHDAEEVSFYDLEVQDRSEQLKGVPVPTSMYIRGHLYKLSDEPKNVGSRGIVNSDVEPIQTFDDGQFLGKTGTIPQEQLEQQIAGMAYPPFTEDVQFMEPEDDSRED